MLHSRLAMFEESGQHRTPCGLGPATSETARWLHLWGSQIELMEKFETASAFSQLSSVSSTAQTRSAASSTQSESLMLVLSSSEELDILSIEVFDIGDSPAIFLQYEELMEVVPQSVSKLNIDCLAKKQEAQRKSTLNKHFLQLPRRGLPLFPDLHTKVSRLWKKPFSSRLTSLMVHHYSSIVGLKENGYGTMPRVEETLAAYLSPDAHPSKPRRCKPSHVIQHLRWLVRCIWRQVRRMLVYTLCPSYKHTRLTCLGTWMLGCY